MKILKLFIVILFISLLSCSDSDDDSNSGDNLDIIIDFNNKLDVLKTFGGSQEEDALSIVETKDGNIAVLGYTQSTNGDVEGKTSTDSDYWLLKLDLDLNIIWQKTYGGTSDDRGQDIISTNDGGFIITGFSRSEDGDVAQNFGFHDYWVIKLNDAGDIIWQKSFGFSGNDRSYAVIQTNDGGYFISGFLDVSASGGEGNDNGTSGRPTSADSRHGVGEFWGIKLDSQGETQWRRYFGGTNNDRAYDVLETHDGNLMMIGSSESNNFDVSNPNGSYDFWVIKLDLQGDMIYNRNFGGSSIEIGYAASTTTDANYMAAGDTRSNDGDITNFRGNTDLWLIKYNEAGQLLWQKTFGGSDFDSGRDVIELINGDYLVCGSTKSNDDQVSTAFGQNDVWVVTTTPNGELISQTSIGGASLDFAQKAIQVQSGHVFVVGSSSSSDNLIPQNKGDKDLLIIKLK